MKTNSNKRFFKALLFAACVIIIYGVITNISSFGDVLMKFVALFSPLLIGILFSLILYKPMMAIYRLFSKLNDKSKAKRKPSQKLIKSISLALTVILALLVLYFVGNSVIPQIINSFKSIFVSVEIYYPQALEYLADLGFDTAEIEKFVNELNFEQIIKTVWKTLTDNANTILNTAVGAISGIAMVVTTFVSALILSIYILSNCDTLKRQAGKLVKAYFKPKTAEKISSIGTLTVKTFLNFFSGQCLEAVILGTIFFIAMSIFGFPYEVVTSVIIAFTAMIPYVGAFIGCGVGALLIFMQSPLKALFFIIMFLVIQQLENNLIYPRVVGTAVNLPAMWTFVAILVGGAVFGVVGMIVFIPLTSILYTLLKNDVNARIKKKDAESGGDGVPAIEPPAGEA